jgi:hypothetical protein
MCQPLTAASSTAQVGIRAKNPRPGWWWLKALVACIMTASEQWLLSTAGCGYPSGAAISIIIGQVVTITVV